MRKVIIVSSLCLRTKYFLLNRRMRSSYLETKAVTIILIIVTLEVVQSRQVVSSTLPDGLDITKNERNTNTKPSFVHSFHKRNFPQRYPSSCLYFSNCPLMREVVFRGGPCRPMKATDRGGFYCGPGIGFPISTVSCKYLFRSTSMFHSCSISPRKFDLG